MKTTNKPDLNKVEIEMINPNLSELPDYFIVKFKKLLNAIRKSQHSERAQLIKLRLLNRHLPPWFVPMLNDSARNNFYEKMIKNHVKDKTVLEIGTGVGLLSIMAVKHGAKHVYACELNPLMFYLAKENIENSPYAKNISLFYAHSDTLKLGVHIPKKVDIILSELISSDIFSEYMAPTLNNAQKLLKKNGIYLPAGIDVFGCLIDLQKALPSKINSLNPSFQLLKDLSSNQSTYIDLNLFPFVPVSIPIKLFTLEDGFKVRPSLPIEFSLKKTKNTQSKNTFFCVFFSINDGKDKLFNLDLKKKTNNCHWENILWELDNNQSSYNLKLINHKERLILLGR
jgi:predicted nicotinamide N-methyase